MQEILILSICNKYGDYLPVLAAANQREIFEGYKKFRADNGDNPDWLMEHTLTTTVPFVQAHEPVVS